MKKVSTKVFLPLQLYYYQHPWQFLLQKLHSI